MKKIFVDDKRSFEEAQMYGYNCVRSFKQCILLLSVFKEIDLINLDYDLGDKETGLDILMYIKQHDIKVKEICVHSTHPTGVSEMEKYICKNFENVKYSYCPYSE